MAAGNVQIIDRDLGWNKIVQALGKIDDAYTAVGLWGEEGDPGTNLAARGAVHEYGSKDERIPSRPFMRQSIDKNKMALNRFIDHEYQKVLRRELSPLKALERIGEFFTGKVKKQIRDGDFKPLSLKTIQAKGSDKPLIDTGDMRLAVTHKEFIR